MNHFPTSKELKLRARHSMAGAFGPCIMTALLLVLATFLLREVLQRAGGTFPLYYWSTDSSDIQSSLSLTSEGLFTALRVEEAGVGISIAITPKMLWTMLGVQLLCAALAAPLRLGCFEQLWAIRRGEPKSTLSLFSHYADPRRGLQAVLLEVILTAVQLVLRLIVAIPAVQLLGDVGPTLEGFTAAIWLLMLGMAAVWCLMTPFVPARYLLAGRENITALGALKLSFALVQGVVGRYLRFRLSFAFWEFCSALSNGVFDLYLFPYQGLSTTHWLEVREQELRDSL